MNRLAAFGSTTLLVASCSGRDSQPLHTAVAKTCGVPAAPTVADTGIGDLVAGRPVEDVKARCVVLRDTVDLGEEALPTRMLSVVIGRDTVIAVVDSERVDHIVIDNPTLRTPDSLGVGTQLRRLLALDSVRAILYESALHVYSPFRCGLGFRVAPEGIREEDLKQEWSARDLARVAPQSQVSEMIVGRCIRSGAPSA